MIFLKSQDCVFKWRFCDMCPPDVNLVRVDRSPLPLSPAQPPPHPPHSSPTPNTHNQCCKVARQKFRPKSSKGATEKKISGRILADFTKNRQKRGRRKFVYCILKINFITVITAKNKELLLKIFCGPFLPVFGKISQNSARNFFFCGPF